MGACPRIESASETDAEAHWQSWRRCYAVYHDVMPLPEEHRLDYGCYRTTPAKLEKHYRRWRARLERGQG